MFGEYITISDALFITAISLVIVFFILLLIQMCISSFKYIFKEEVPKSNLQNVKENAITKVSDVENDEDELAALMFALIHCNENLENKKFVVTNIKELN